jgi:hypothetical protein
MWIVMAKGNSYYVEHVEANIPWTTKETPDNVRTKGAIKFKDCLVTIDEDNCAKIRVLTPADEARIRNQERGIVRIISNVFTKLTEALDGIEHGPIKRFSTGACGSSYWVTDLLDPQESSMFMLQHMSKNQWFRILQPNERFYYDYDDVDAGNVIDDPGILEDDEDFYD